MVDPTRLMVVEDDAIVRQLLVQFLSAEAFDVQCACDARQTWPMLRRFKPHIVLLDIGLPDADGFSVAQTLRRSFDLGLIIITARTNVTDRVKGLESGADDYITKPFQLQEVTARIRSLMRRITNAKKNAHPEDSVGFDGWTFNLYRRELISPDGSRVDITSKEYDMLKLLVSNPGRTLSRDEIASHFGCRHYNPLTRNIDVVIHHLRAKIEPRANQPRFIKTVRGVGFVFTGQLLEGTAV